MEHEYIIGHKATLAYAGAIISNTEPSTDQIKIIGSGKNIVKAIDVALIVAQQIKILKILKIDLTARELVNRKEQPITISAIKITLGRGN